MHLHHFVWGIFLMLGAGFVGLGVHMGEPWDGIVAAVFGVGAGFTLDEFALWTRMEDVYWRAEGRSSLEAVAVVATVGALVVIGVRPFELDDPGSAVTVSAVIVVSLSAAVVAILKGRIALGAIGVFLAPVGLIGAIRLARPGSPWARRRYAAGSERMRRCQQRFERESRFLSACPTRSAAPRARPRCSFARRSREETLGRAVLVVRAVFAARARAPFPGRAVARAAVAAGLLDGRRRSVALRRGDPGRGRGVRLGSVRPCCRRLGAHHRRPFALAPAPAVARPALGEVAQQFARERGGLRAIRVRAPRSASSASGV